MTVLLEQKEEEPNLTWKDICEIAANQVKKIEGENYLSENENATHCWIGAQTILKWFCHFRHHSESFVNVPSCRSCIDKLPLIFDLNPNLKDQFISFAKSNITALTGEVMYDYFHHTIIP